MYSEYKCKGMTDEFFTIVGVLLLGLNHGLMQAYLDSSETASSFSEKFFGLIFPTGLEIALSVFLIWAISASQKQEINKTLLISALIFIDILEMYYIHYKPTEWIWLGKTVLFASSLFKLYLFVTLHCGVTSSRSKSMLTKFFNRLTKKPERTERPERERQERQERTEVKPEVDIARAKAIFNEVLKKSPLSSDEMEEANMRFTNGFQEENPWNTLWNTFNNSVLQKIDDDVLSKEQKDETRNSFRVAMGKQPK